jgi:hypothetical protein
VGAAEEAEGASRLGQEKGLKLEMVQVMLQGLEQELKQGWELAQDSVSGQLMALGRLLEFAESAEESEPVLLQAAMQEQATVEQWFAAVPSSLMV